MEGNAISLMRYQLSPEPVYLRRKALRRHTEGELYVRSGPGTARLNEQTAEKYVATRFASR